MRDRCPSHSTSSGGSNIAAALFHVVEHQRLRLALAVLFVAWLVVYGKRYGIKHFFWFCDTGLILFFLAAISNNCFIMSMAGLTIPGFVMWTVGFLLRVTANIHVSSLSDYMFDASRPIVLRLWSLTFHLLMPICVMLWMTHWCEYHSNAVYFTLLLGWVVVLVARFGTDGTQNINMVFSKPQSSWILVGSSMSALVIAAHFLWKLMPTVP